MRYLILAFLLAGCIGSNPPDELMCNKACLANCIEVGASAYPTERCKSDCARECKSPPEVAG